MHICDHFSDILSRCRNSTARNKLFSFSVVTSQLFDANEHRRQDQRPTNKVLGNARQREENARERHRDEQPLTATVVQLPQTAHQSAQGNKYPETVQWN